MSILLLSKAIATRTLVQRPVYNHIHLPTASSNQSGKTTLTTPKMGGQHYISTVDVKLRWADLMWLSCTIWLMLYSVFSRLRLCPGGMKQLHFLSPTPNYDRSLSITEMHQHHHQVKRKQRMQTSDPLSDFTNMDSLVLSKGSEVRNQHWKTPCA